MRCTTAALPLTPALCSCAAVSHLRGGMTAITSVVSVSEGSGIIKREGRFGDGHSSTTEFPFMTGSRLMHAVRLRIVTANSFTNRTFQTEDVRTECPRCRQTLLSVLLRRSSTAVTVVSRPSRFGIFLHMSFAVILRMTPILCQVRPRTGSLSRAASSVSYRVRSPRTRGRRGALWN